MGGYQLTAIIAFKGGGLSLYLFGIDLEFFAAGWLDTGCGSCGFVDLDGDHNVNMQDWAIFSGYWLK